MKKIYTLLFLLTSIGIYAQQNFNLELVSEVVFDEAGNDIWGYVAPDSTEYAIVGSRTASRIYSLEDPANPVLVASIPGPPSTWRDFKSWNDHIYVTTDQGGTTEGLVIIDMTEAPNNITSTNWQPFINHTNGDGETISGQLNTCHNIYIDENGFAYLAGCGGVGRGGVIILDLNQDPKMPVVVGIEDTDYAHDVFVRGDTLYASEINVPGHLSIYDISDRLNIVQLSTTETSSSFCHNTWISDDGNFAFTTDERPNAFVDAYDISDMDNVVRVDQFQPAETAGNGVIPHNTHYMDGYLITSWYTDGLVITDVSNPDIMINVGQYDTWVGPDGNFNGCWGAYPWLPSGLILASNVSGINQGGSLLVFQPTYERGCYLRGQATDSNTGAPISNVEVVINSVELNQESTDANGEYGTGVATSGTFDVTFNHPDYFPLSVSVVLENGETTRLDVEMDRFETFRIEGVTVDAEDGSIIPFAEILVQNEERSVGFISDLNGQFSEEIINGTYDMYVGKWGYLHASFEDLVLQEDLFLTVEKDRGFQDDFVFDLGWQETSINTTSGFWVRETPIGTPFGQQSLANPGEDIPDDLGEMCYVTGNGGGGAGTDDIDSVVDENGTVRITSDVMDLTMYNEPFVNYRTWFFNDGGNGTLDPNDTLTISMTNGVQNFVLETITESDDIWRPTSSIKISDFIEVTSTMQLIVESGDYQVGHVVECGFDQFLVTEGEPSSVNNIDGLDEFIVRPNPFTNSFEVLINNSSDANLTMRVLDIQGKTMVNFDSVQNGVNSVNLNNQPSGIYILQLTDGISSSHKKLIKQ
jgi:choice-of-anchor B domain-containing protein